MRSITIEKVANMAINPLWLSYNRQNKSSLRFPSTLKTNFSEQKQKSAQLIAFPEQKKHLEKEIKHCQLLGDTTDGKVIYITCKQSSPSIMREIGRLREVSFRAVGEGSGKSRDIDKYDKHYEQIFLWDAKAREIVGGYRLCSAQHRKAIFRKKPLYIQSLFDIKPELKTVIQQSVELGRSFIQPNYWGKRNLDYLWMGIGAYLYKHPQIRYIFGPVTIPNHFSDKAKDLIFHYYSTYYQSATSKTLITPKNPHVCTTENPFINNNSQQDLRLLKELLLEEEASIPALYKHYTEISDNNGTHVLGFNIDPDFQNCIDAFIITDRNKMKHKKRLRYIDRHSTSNTEVIAHGQS